MKRKLYQKQKESIELNGEEGKRKLKERVPNKSKEAFLKERTKRREVNITEEKET